VNTAPHATPLAWVNGSDAPEKPSLDIGFMPLTDIEAGKEVKHRPLQSHGPLLSPDVFGDGVKGAEGGNPDSLESRGFPYTYFSDIILTVHIPACRGILHSFGQTIRPADINESIIEWFSLVLLDTSV